MDAWSAGHHSAASTFARTALNLSARLAVACRRTHMPMSGCRPVVRIAWWPPRGAKGECGVHTLGLGTFQCVTEHQMHTRTLIPARGALLVLAGLGMGPPLPARPYLAGIGALIFIPSLLWTLTGY
jgi:hypothetical protein